MLTTSRSFTGLEKGSLSFGNQGKTKGRATTKGQNHFIIFHNFRTFSHFFRNFPPGLSPSKQRVLAQSEQKRRKDNKNNWTNRCCTLVVARLSLSFGKVQFLEVPEVLEIPGSPQSVDKQGEIQPFSDDSRELRDSRGPLSERPLSS